MFSFYSLDVNSLDIISEELEAPVFDSEGGLVYYQEGELFPLEEEESEEEEEEAFVISNDNLPRLEVNNLYCEGLVSGSVELDDSYDTYFIEDGVLGSFTYRGVVFYVLKLKPFLGFYFHDESVYFYDESSPVVQILILKDSLGFSLDCRSLLFVSCFYSFNSKPITIKSRISNNGSLWIPFVFRTKPKNDDFSSDSLKKVCVPYFRQKFGFTYINKFKSVSFKHTFFSSYYVLSGETKFSLVMSHLEDTSSIEGSGEEEDVFNLYSYTIKNHLCSDGSLGFRYRRFYERDFIERSSLRSGFFKRNRFTKRGEVDPEGFIDLEDKVEIDSEFGETRPFPVYYRPRKKGSFNIPEGCLYPTSYYMEVCESGLFWDFHREYTSGSRSCYSFWFCSPVCGSYVYFNSLLTISDFFSEFIVRTCLVDECLLPVEGYGFYDRMFPEPFNKSFDLLNRPSLLSFRSNNYLSRLCTYSMPSYLRLSDTEPYKGSSLQEIYIETYVRSHMRASSPLRNADTGGHKGVRFPSRRPLRLTSIQGKVYSSFKSWNFIESFSDLGNASESSRVSFLNSKNISLSLDKYVLNELVGSTSRKLLNLRLKGRLLMGDVHYNGSPVLNKIKTAELKRELLVNDMLDDFGEERSRLILEAGKSKVRKFEVCFDSSAFDE